LFAATPAPSAPGFPYPLRACPKIAVFAPALAHGPATVACADVADLPHLGAATVAAPMRVLYELQRSDWRPEFPVVVLSTSETGLASPADRDFIWYSLRVPLLEYLLDSEGRIIARECEGHDGLHVEGSFETGALGEVVSGTCGCGKEGARLRYAEAIIEKAVQSR
jgi:hypothetical protein